MNKTRITKAMRFEDIKALLNGETVTYGTTVEQAVEFIDKEMGLLARKNSGDKKPTKTQQANEGTKVAIKEYLDGHKDEKFTVSALMKAVPAIADASNQKVSALIRQMVADGQAKRIEDKRKAYFSAC